MYWVHILFSRQNNIFQAILAQTAAKIFHFHVYWLLILWPRQTIFPEVSQCWQLPKSFIFTHIECAYYVESAKCTAICWAVIWTNVGHSNIHIMFITGPHYAILRCKSPLGPPRSSNVYTRGKQLSSPGKNVIKCKWLC